MRGCRLAVPAVLALGSFALAGAKPSPNPNLLDAAARLEAGSSE
jgi:hypothetical protein